MPTSSSWTDTTGLSRRTADRRGADGAVPGALAGRRSRALERRRRRRPRWARRRSVQGRGGQAVDPRLLADRHEAVGDVEPRARDGGQRTGNDRDVRRHLARGSGRSGCDHGCFRGAPDDSDAARPHGPAPPQCARRSTRVPRSRERYLWRESVCVRLTRARYAGPLAARDGNQPGRSSRCSRWRRTAGHSPSTMLKTTVSRRLPSGISWWLRSTPSCLAPSRAIAARDA